MCSRLQHLLRRRLSCVAWTGLLLISFAAWVADTTNSHPKDGSNDSIQIDNALVRPPLRVIHADGKLIIDFSKRRQHPDHSEMLPPHLVRAVLAAEDPDFFQRKPVPSRISLQLVTIQGVIRDHSFNGRLRRIQAAQDLEKRYRKQQILRAYLKGIYLGQRCYGVAAAAKHYFKQSVQELTLAQAALLAGLIKSPARYNPKVHPARARVRRNQVLQTMYHHNWISFRQLQKAMAAPVQLKLNFHPGDTPQHTHS